MWGFIKRLFFILFWEGIAVLFILLLKPKFYIPWLIACIALIFIFSFISVKIIPSKKERRKIKELGKKYMAVLENEFNVKTKADLLELTCPSCQHKTNYWEFLNEKACPKCDSKLWSTLIAEQPQDYYELFLEKEKNDRFLSSISFRQKGKLKKLALDI